MPNKKTPKKATAKAPKKATKSTPKKTPKKSTAKTTKASAQPKSRTKKSASKTTSKKRVRALVCAPGEKCFWTTDGRVLEDLNQLQMAFGSMGEDVFLHHVTKEKNDFADWVEHVLHDAACAADLRRSRKPSTARTVVIRHLRLYNI